MGDGGIIGQGYVEQIGGDFGEHGFGDDLSVLIVALSFLKPVRLRNGDCGACSVAWRWINWHMTAGKKNAYLDVKENFMGLNHYYEDNTLPSKEETIAKINQVILNWK